MYAGKTFSQLHEDQKRLVLVAICGDDWSTLLKTVAPPALNFLWKTLKNSSLGRRAERFLADQLGLDLNDDGAYLGNPFTSNLSLHKNIRWEDFSPDYLSASRAYDGVSC